MESDERHGDRRATIIPPPPRGSECRIAGYIHSHASPEAGGRSFVNSMPVDAWNGVYRVSQVP